MARIKPLQITERMGVTEPTLLPNVSLTSTDVPAQKIQYMDYSIGQANAQASMLVAQELGAMVDKVGQAAIYIDKVKKQHEQVQIDSEFQAFGDKFKTDFAQEHTSSGQQRLYNDYQSKLVGMKANAEKRLGSSVQAQEHIAGYMNSAKKLSADAFSKIQNKRLNETDSLYVLQNKQLQNRLATDQGLDTVTALQSGADTIGKRVELGSITEEYGALLKQQFTTTGLNNRSILIGRASAKFYAQNPADIPETAQEMVNEFNKGMGFIGMTDQNREIALDTFTTTFHKELAIQLQLDTQADKALRIKEKDYILNGKTEVNIGVDKGTLTNEVIEKIASGLHHKGLFVEEEEIRAKGRAYFNTGAANSQRHAFWTDPNSEGNNMLKVAGFLEHGVWQEEEAIAFIKATTGETHPATLNSILSTLRRQDAKRIDDFTTETKISNSMVPYLHKTRIALKYLDETVWDNYTTTDKVEGRYIEALSKISPELGLLMSNVKTRVENARLTASTDPKSPMNERSFADITQQGKDYNEMIRKFVDEEHAKIMGQRVKKPLRVEPLSIKELETKVNETNTKALDGNPPPHEDAKKIHQERLATIKALEEKEQKEIEAKEKKQIDARYGKGGSMADVKTLTGKQYLGSGKVELGFQTEEEIEKEKEWGRSNLVRPLVEIGRYIKSKFQEGIVPAQPEMKKYQKQRREELMDDLGEIFGPAYDAVTEQLSEEFEALGTLFGGGEGEDAVVTEKPKRVSTIEGTKALNDLTKQFEALPERERVVEIRNTFNTLAERIATEQGKATPDQKTIDYYFEILHGMNLQHDGLKDPESWVEMIRKDKERNIMKFETYPRANPNELFDTGDVSGVAGGLPEGLPEQDGEYASRFINKVGEGLGFAPPEPVAQPVKDKSALYPPPKDFATQPEPVVSSASVTSNAPDWIKSYGNAAIDLFDKEGLKNTVYPDVDVKGNLKGHAAGLGHRLTPSEFKRWDGKTIPDSQIQTWFKKDYAKYSKAAEAQAQQIPNINTTLQDALISVNWQLGAGWNKEFKRAWQHLKDNKWESAIAEFEYKKEGGSQKSDWNTQTPKRVAALVSAIRTQTGEKPEASTSLEPTMVRSARENLFGFDGVRTMKQFKAEEQVEVKRVASIAIERGKQTGNYEFSYKDYDEEGGENLSYQMDEDDIRWTDPAYNAKMTIGEGRVVRYKGKLYVADEVNFVDQQFLKGSDEYTGEKPLDQREIGERVKFILGEIQDKGFSLYGLGHRLNEAFGAGMGKGASIRAELGSPKDFNLSAAEFKKIPTLEDYEADKLAEGAINPKNIGKVA